MGSAGKFGMAGAGAIVGGLLALPTGGLSVIAGAMIGAGVGGVVGGILFPTKAKTDMPSVASYPIQRCDKGSPVPKIYGTCKVAGNVIWMSKSVAHTEEVESGGKGGMMGTPGMETTTYTKSFLIAVCEGPAEISKIWEGKKEIALTRATIFTGNGNSGLDALLGEHCISDKLIAAGVIPTSGAAPVGLTYSKICCVYFQDFNLGMTEQLPNFVFEVCTVRPAVIVGRENVTVGQALLTKIDSNGNIDLSWGVSGNYINQGENTVVSSCLLRDGSIVFSHGKHDYGSGLMSITKLTVNGIIDTTFGTNGHLYPIVSSYATNLIQSIVEDSSGNLYMAGDTSSSGKPTLFKYSSSGVLIWSQTYTAGSSYLSQYLTLALNSNETRLFAGGQVGNKTGVGWFSLACYLTSAGTVDTTWGISGFWPISVFPSYVEALIREENDHLWVRHTGLSLTPEKYITNLNASGTILFNLQDGREVGIMGQAQSSWSLDTSNRLWSITKYNDAGTPTTTSLFLRIYNTDGNQIGTTITHTGGITSTTGIYCISLIGGFYLMGGTVLSLLGNNTLGCFYLNHSRVLNYPLVNLGNKKVVIVMPILMGEGEDDNPAEVIKDLLTNTRYGAGISEVNCINSSTFASVAQYCESQDLLCSFNINQQKTVLDWIDYVCSHFGGFLYMSQGKICLGCFRDQSSVATITRSSLCSEAGENAKPPVDIKKREYSDTYNQVEITWTNRSKNYDTSVVVANDEVDQRISGKVRKKAIQMAGITSSSLAQRIAYRLLIESMYRFSIYTFVLSYKDMLLEIGDVATLSDGFAISNQRIRIVAIKEDKDGRGLAIEAVEDTAYLYPVISYTPETTLREEDPAIVLVNAKCTFREDLANPYLYLSMVPGGADTNGWYVYKSFDNVSFEYIGRCTIPEVSSSMVNSYGTLESNLPAHTAVCHCSDESLLVNIGIVTVLDTAITGAQFFGNKKLARIGDEIVAYNTCVLTGTTGVWEITGLIRGLFGTTPVAHFIGEAFYTLNVNFTYIYQSADVGKTIYFKLLTFYGNEVQELADVTSIAHVIKGEYKRPASASLIRLTTDENSGGEITYSGPTFTLYWNLGSRVSGFNVGGLDVDEDGVSRWRYRSNENDLLSSNGVPYGSYAQDPELEKVRLLFEKTDGTLIGQREIAVGSSEIITKATDLGGEVSAIIKVVPRRTLLASEESDIIATQT